METFSIENLNSPKDFEVNSYIMELASDNATELTELECKLNNIEPYIEENNELRFTDEAQEIFNVHYDKQVDDLYKLVNFAINQL
jgi:hypothetical protein